MSIIASPPYKDDIVQSVRDAKGQQHYLMTGTFLNWLQNSLVPPVQTSTQLIGSSVTLTGKSASIPTTPIPLPSLASGLYRVSWYLRDTTSAGVSSSTQVTIGWTETGTAQSFVGALVNGNTTTTIDSASSPLIQVDQAASITYAIAYNSNPAGAMVFSFRLAVEKVA